MNSSWRDRAHCVFGIAWDRGPSGPLGRRSVLATGLAAGAAFALSGLGSRWARAADDSGAEARRFVTNLSSKAIAVMADHAMGDSQRAQQFRDLLVSSFDLPAIGQLVLGRHWRSASPDQRARFLKLFERQQVLTWAGRFKYFSGQKIIVELAEAEPGGWQVASHVDTVGGQPVPVDWTVIQSGNALHIIDVEIAGASLAFTLRQDFGAVLQANGGKFDALLAAMQKKIDEMSAG